MSAGYWNKRSLDLLVFTFFFNHCFYYIFVSWFRQKIVAQSWLRMLYKIKHRLCSDLQMKWCLLKTSLTSKFNPKSSSFVVAFPEKKYIPLHIRKFSCLLGNCTRIFFISHMIGILCLPGAHWLFSDCNHSMQGEAAVIGLPLTQWKNNNDNNSVKTY